MNERSDAEKAVLREIRDPRKTSGERLVAIKRLTGTATFRGDPGFEDVMRTTEGNGATCETLSLQQISAGLDAMRSIKP